MLIKEHQQKRVPYSISLIKKKKRESTKKTKKSITKKSFQQIELTGKSQLKSC